MDTYKVHKKTSVLNIRFFPPKAAPIFRPDFRSTDIVKYNKITHLTRDNHSYKALLTKDRPYFQTGDFRSTDIVKYCKICLYVRL
jgi:hypothetical protein